MQSSRPARPDARAFLVALGVVGALVAGGCTDDGPLLFPPAHRAVPLLEGTPSGTVGEQIRLGPVFYLEDRLGNRAAGVRVPVDLVEGDGQLGESFAVSDPQGRVAPPELTLDTIAGPNRIRFRPPGLPERELVVEGNPGPVARLDTEPESMQLGTLEVGTELPMPIVARLTDEYGNPVRGYPVRFAPLEGGGRAGGEGLPGQTDVAVVPTDADGTASARWTLGQRPGPNRLGVQTELLPSRIYEADAIAGPLSALTPRSPTDQTGQTGEPVQSRPRVRAEDQFGNPLEGIEVRFEIAEGAGTVTPSTITTDSTGLAETDAWTLGPDEGAQTLRASAGPVTTDFTAMAVAFPPGPPVRIAAVHLNQGSQTLEGDIDIVAGRPGLLRVFLTAPEALELAPDVEIEIRDGPVLVERVVVSAQSDSIRASAALEPGEWSWNLPVDADLVRPGLGVRVTVDPEGEFWEEEGSGPVYPDDGGVALLPVVEIDPLQVLLVPVEQAPTGLVGRIDASNADTFLSDTRRMLPVSGVEWQLRAPYTTQIRITNDFDRWNSLLSELLAVRTDQETGGAYWYGVVQPEYSRGIAGIGYILPNAANPERVSVGWDLPNTAAYIAAHELGHNLGRRHAPCGVGQSLDPNFPYPNAGLGATGWDRESGGLVSSATHADFMSYCLPAWTSDYTFTAILDRLSTLSVLSSARFATRPTEGLLVWGRIDRNGMHLEPAFESSGPPVLPAEPGPYRITGRDSTGTVLFQFAFRGTPIDHSDDPSARHFAFRVPLDSDQREQLHRIELGGRGGGGTRSLLTRPAAPEAGALRAGAPAMQPERMAPDRIRLEWDATVHPLLVVRDPEGNILTLARGGRAEVRTSADHLHLYRSRGLGGDALQVRVPR